MFYFIVNPKSCSGRGLTIWNQLKAHLDANEVPYQYKLTEFAGHAKELATKFTDEISENPIIILGGDGTLNEVINGLSHFEHIILGYIPSGSSNDFTRSLGTPRSPLNALQHMLEDPQYYNLDIGVVQIEDQARYFVVSSGIGFDAAVCKEVNKSKIKNILNKVKLGKLSYLAIAIKQVIKSKGTSGTILIDDQEYPLKNLIFASAQNHKYEGGGFMFCPDAKPDDGILDIIYAQNMSKPKMFATLPFALKGNHTDFQGIHISKCEHNFSLKLERPLAIHTDGEYLCDSTEATFQLHADKIRFFA